MENSTYVMLLCFGVVLIGVVIVAIFSVWRRSRRSYSVLDDANIEIEMIDINTKEY